MSANRYERRGPQQALKGIEEVGGKFLKFTDLLRPESMP